MERQIITKTLQVEGMTCPSCEMRIESKLKKLPGIMTVQAKYADGIVQLSYDSGQIELLEIIETIESLDYTVKSTRQHVSNDKNTGSSRKNSDITFLLGAGIILFALYFLIENTIGFNFIPEVNQNMGYAVLFVVGLLTSLHCIAMCGGINLSQCVSYSTGKSDNISKLKPSILYNAGRVVSYTVIGGIVGGIGSVISLSGSAKGLVSVLAGVFMIIMGLNMLNIFPWLRKLTPRMPRFFGNKIHNNNGKNGPFYVGLLNGLMPCGPLQTMQIYALGAGSIASGALSMFLFSMGTVPLMFGFGAVSSMLSSKFTNKMMKVSAILVMVLGIVMLNRGFSLSGFDPLAFASTSAPVNSGAASNYENPAVVKDGVQYVTTKFTGRGYAPITVQKGIPVKWTIQIAQNDINGCNNPMQIPKYDIQVKFSPGDNLVEFTPDESGIVPYSCWMGMIRNRIIVVDDLLTQAVVDSSTNDSSVLDNIPSLPIDNGISTDTIVTAKVTDGVQEVTVTLTDKDFSPGIIVLQEGIDFVINFDVKIQLDESDPNSSIIYFPEYGGGVDLLDAPETPLLSAVGDFSFQDAIGSKRVFVKVVEDINNIDKESIIKDAQSYTVSSGGGGGASCH